MYKKITHTITEEHFDHPMAGEVKAAVDRFKISNLTKEDFSNFVLNYFNTYNDKVSKLIDAGFIPTDVTVLETEIFEMIDSLGNYAKELYGFDFGERLNSIMRGVTLTYMNGISAARQKLDTLFFRNRLDGLANDLSNLFTNYNNRWLYNDVYNLSRDWFISRMDQIESLGQKNTTAAEEFKNKSSSAALTLANAFVNGTLERFPGRFTVVA